MSRLFLLLLLFLCSSLNAVLAAAPPLMLASSWQDGPDVSLYLVSEKLDGVRARWDGHALWTRAGHRIPTPAWFTKGWPKQAIDGELWMARGQFEATSALIRSSPADEAQWRKLRFMAFDLPHATDGFARRHAQLSRIIANQANPYLHAIEQRRMPDTESLHRHLRSVVQAGGEGLMLHRADAPYLTGRSDALLKMKRWNDAEATVVGHRPGKGKFAGMLGALQMRTPDGTEFLLGTGLDETLRCNPPPVGTLVTYRYRELTAQGRPRFASFYRIQEF